MEKFNHLITSEILNTILIKDKLTSKHKWMQVISYTLSTISIIYLSIANSVSASTNIVFIYTKICDTYMKQNRLPIQILEWILLLSAINVAGCSIIGISINNSEIKNSKNIHFHNNIRKYLAYSLLFYEFSMIPLSSIVAVYIRSLNWIINVSAIILVAIINQSYKIQHIYGQYYFLVVSLLWVASSSNFPIFMALLSMMLAYRQDSKVKKLFYLQVFLYNTVIFINCNWEVDMSLFHMVVMTLSTPPIVLLVPAQFDYNSIEANQIILRCLGKINKSQAISKQQQRQIYSILHTHEMQSQLHHFSYQKQQKQILQSIHIALTKQNLSALLKRKIKVNKILYPLAVMLEIHYIQCQLLTASFTINLLKKIQTVNKLIEQNSTFQERLKMMNLANNIENDYLKIGEQNLTTDIVFVQKCLEKLNQKMGSILSTYISIWGDLSNSIHERQFMKRINSLCRDEQECRDLLNTLNDFKKMEFQQLLYNYLQKKFNISDSGMFIRKIRQTNQSLIVGMTNFIVIYKDAIIDIAKQLANQLQSNKDALLYNSIYSIIPIQFQQYFKQHLSKWLVANQNEYSIILPFTSFYNNRIFYPLKCKFRIFSPIRDGIQYLIHVDNNYYNHKQSFIIYSQTEDKIIMLSKTFTIDHNLQETPSSSDHSYRPEELLGIDLTFLSTHTKIEDQDELLCELNIDKFSRKITRSRMKKPQIMRLRLAEIYQVSNDRYFLLAVTPKSESHRSRTINEVILEQQTKSGYSDSFRSDRQQNNKVNFCTIKNPLQEVIQQRLNKYSHLGNQSYFKLILLIFSLIFSSYIATIIYFQVQINTSLVSVTSSITKFSTSVNQPQSVYLLFLNFYISIHLNHYPQHYLSVYPGLNIAKYRQKYRNKVIGNVDNLISMAVDSNIKLKAQHYEIEYDNYVLEGTSNQMMLVPLLQSIQAYYASESFDLVLHNSGLVDLYVQSVIKMNPNIVQSTLDQQYYVLLSVFVVICLLCFIVKGIKLRIRNLLWKILDLYCMLSKQQIQNQQSTLNRLKIILLQNDRIFSKLQQNEEIPENKLKYPTLKANKLPHVSKQSLLEVFLSRNIVLFALMTFTLTYYCYCYLRLDSFRADVNSVINYTSSIESFSRVNTYSAQRFFQIATQQIIPPSHRVEFQPITSFSLPNLDTDNLPEQFYGFIDQQSSILQYNICQSAITAKMAQDSFLNSINCRKVFNGVLEKGFSEAFVYTTKQLSEVTGTGLSDLGKLYLDNNIYPIFAEAIYCRKALDVVIAQLSAAYRAYIRNFIASRIGQFKLLISYGAFLSILLLLLMVSYLKRVKEICRLVRKSFDLLPRQFVYNIKTSKMLINSGLLDAIQFLQL